MRIILLTITLLSMNPCVDIWSQSSSSLTGLWNIWDKNTTLLNTLENNASGLLLVKDWGLSFSFGGEFTDQFSSNLYFISLSKKLGNNIFSARYSPGFTKEFVFSNGGGILLEDSSFQQLSSKFSYKEMLGLGYAYNFSSNLSLGFSLRYFTQKFDYETFKPVSFGDTLFILEPDNRLETSNYWRGDIGFNYALNQIISFSASSINLFNIEEDNISSENKNLKIKTDKGIALRTSFQPFRNASLNTLYESSGAFQFGLSSVFSFSDWNLGLSLSAQHDQYQTPFINGLSGGLIYSNNLFGISISGIKYLSNRSIPFSYSEFRDKGIHELMNNKYSFDKACLTLSLTLNTIPEKMVKFLSVNINKEIYPTFFDAYIDSPFAYARAVNLTEKSIIVKPLCKIENINESFFSSPAVTIQPKDTVTIPFFISADDNYSKRSAAILQAEFSLIASNEEPDDVFQTPVLIYGINSWDGNVNNLKYFIKKDYDYSMRFSKNSLNKTKNLLDTIPHSLSPFYQAKIIFEDFAKEIIYTSDRRATTEYVQFPQETLQLHGGDCDDLSVCYSSLLESVGIETALVDYRSNNEIKHVNILFNTKLAPDNAMLITENDTKYFIRKDEEGNDEIWIPIETTELTDFYSAWSLGAEKFFDEAIKNLGLATNKVEIIDIY